ncbi:MAG: hypothetical protein WAK14_08695, partial [Methanobacterium sp.]
MVCSFELSNEFIKGSTARLSPKIPRELAADLLTSLLESFNNLIIGSTARLSPKIKAIYIPKLYFSNFLSFLYIFFFISNTFL